MKKANVRQRFGIGYCLVVISFNLAATEFHVTPEGTADGDGSRAQPWDLATVFAHPEQVKPGDTIWLHGGEYRGSFESRLTGKAKDPIIVRQVPGERATIHLEKDKKLGVGLFLRGEHVRFQDFEVACDHPKRKTETPGSWPADMQRGSVNVRGSHLQLINLVLHDMGSGMGLWSEAEGGEVYGCLIFNNGWMAPDRSHGHGIYTQNEKGIKTIADCLIFKQFGGGIHLYGSDKASLRGFRLTGVAAFDNGRPGQTRDLLVGGGAPLDDIVIENCFTRGSGLQIGYGARAKNRSVIARNNYLIGGLKLQYPGDYLVEGNTMIAGASLLTIQLREGQELAGLKIGRNQFHKTEVRWNPFAIYSPDGNRGGDISLLREAGFDENSTYAATAPPETRIFVQPNRHQPGRAHVIVFNWGKLLSVDVDLQNILESGQRFRIVHARDFFGKPVAEGVFNGEPVSIPMTPRKAVPPIGMESEKETTDLDFGAFVVLPAGDPESE